MSGPEVYLQDCWRFLNYRIRQPGLHLSCTRNVLCMLLKFEVMAPSMLQSLLSLLQVLAYLSAVHAAIVILVGTGLRWVLFRSVVFHRLPPCHSYALLVPFIP